MSPFLKNDWPLLWAPCVWISLVKSKLAENYLNSYFNILQRESHVAGFAVEHALTKHYHEGLKRGATRDTLVRLSCALERLLLIIYCSLISSRTRVNSYTPFHSTSLCFANKHAISQITVFLYIYSILPDKSEKYVCCLWFDFQI